MATNCTVFIPKSCDVKIAVTSKKSATTVSVLLTILQYGTICQGQRRWMKDPVNFLLKWVAFCQDAILDSECEGCSSAVSSLNINSKLQFKAYI